MREGKGALSRLLLGLVSYRKQTRVAPTWSGRDPHFCVEPKQAPR